MSQHEITYMQIGNVSPVEHAARCECGWRSKRYPRKQGAEDEVIAHHVYIERVKANLGSRTPSLASQRAYFRLKQKDPSTPEAHRTLWGQLADEIDVRLNSKATPSEQPMLWDA